MHERSECIRPPGGTSITKECDENMPIEVDTGLASQLEQLNTKIEEAALASKVASFLLLASAMNLDATNGVDAQRILRHLKSVESYVKSAGA